MTMPDYVQAKALARVQGFVLDEPSATKAVAASLAPVDGVCVDDLLSAAECARLVEAAEVSGGFAFWDPDGGEERRTVRNADTLEFEDAAFCEVLWSRLAPFVPSSALFAPEDEEQSQTL